MTDNTILLVKCTFIINSTSTGFAAVENVQNGELFEGELQRLPDDSDKGSVNITDLPAGEYSVRVYDSMIEYVNDSVPAYEHSETLYISALHTAPSPTIISPSSIMVSTGKMKFYSARAILNLLLVLPVSGSSYSLSAPTITPENKSSGM